MADEKVITTEQDIPAETLENLSNNNEFDEDTFLEFVDSVTILTRSEFVFNLKCGLKLTERMRL